MLHKTLNWPIIPVRKVQNGNSRHKGRIEFSVEFLHLEMTATPL